MISDNAKKKSVLTTTPVVIISGAGNTMKNKLNEAVSVLLKQLKEMDAKFKINIDVSVIHFNRYIKTAVDFKPLKEINKSDIIVNDFSEGSYMGQAILKGINMADEHRLKLIRESGNVVRLNQPLVFLLTDGQPDTGVGATDEEKEEVRLAFEEACNLIKAKEDNKKITFIAVGIEHENSNISVDTLRKLTAFPERVITYDGQEIDFFKSLLFYGNYHPYNIERLMADLEYFQ